MFLAKPGTCEALNAYFVPVTIDSTTYEGREYWFQRIQRQVVKQYPFVMGPCGWIIDGDGQPVRILDVQFMQHRPDEALQVLRDVIAERHLKPAAPLPPAIPDVLQAVKPSDTVLHVNARFLVDEQLNSLDSRVTCLLNLAPVDPNPAPIIPLDRLFRIRRISPVDEWLVLSNEQRERLLPPAGTRSRYNVPPDVSALLFRRLCPPTFNARLDGSVFENQLTGRVVMSKGHETWVELRGRYASQHHIWGNPDSNLAEGQVVGYFGFDTAKRTITRFGLTTDPGIYGDRVGFRVPFSATMELWQASPEHPAIGALHAEDYPNP